MESQDPNNRDETQQPGDAPSEQPAGPAGEQPTEPTQEQPTSPAQAQPIAQPPPRRLMRSRSDRILGGVCGGLGRYFGADPILFRIGMVALVLLGGAGVLLYLAAWLLVPQEPAAAPAAPGAQSATAASPAPQGQRTALTVLGIVLLVIIGGPLLLGALALVVGGGLVLGAIAIPLALLALLGIAVWWLSSGERPEGSREVLRAALLGLGVLLIASTIAICGAWAAAVGGGTVMAALVVAAGAVLVIGAFVGRVRWLIFPALALALSVAFVAAADIDLDGGIGEREYRPASATDLRDRYELGMGRLVVDLRNADLPAGETPVKVRLGIGEAVLIVPEDVCVASRADVGMGAVNVFDRENAGVDVSWEDTPRSRANAKRVVLDADVGLGALTVDYTDPESGGFHGGRDFRDGRGFDGRGSADSSFTGTGNRACEARS